MQNKAKLFNLKLFPMDMGRMVCSVLLPIYRMKKITPTGEKYKRVLRGGAVIAANHTSFADPFLVGVAFWYRRMFFLIAEAVMQGKLRTTLLKGMGGIKIDRNAADIEAIRRSVNTLKEGHLLSIFPEGGIKSDENINTIKSGAVLIAMQAGVPIIPMYILPKKSFFSRRVVVIGEAVIPNEICKKRFPSTTDINEITNKLMCAMQECAQWEDKI